MNKFIIIFLGLTACSVSIPAQTTFRPATPVISQAMPSNGHPDAVAGVLTVHSVISGQDSYRSDEFQTGIRGTRWRLYTDTSTMSIGLVLVVESRSESWSYKDCDDVAILADGQEVPVPVPLWEGTQQPTTEYVYVVLPAESAASLARASKVQIRYCRSVMEFPLEGRQAIGEMIRRMNLVQ